VTRTVIAGGEVVTAGSRFVADLMIADGKIVQIGGDMPSADGGVRVLDAAGYHVLPGGVDMHVHLSPAFTPAGVGPGGVATEAGPEGPAAGETVHYWSDDFASGSRAAAGISGPRAPRPIPESMPATTARGRRVRRPARSPSACARSAPG